MRPSENKHPQTEPFTRDAISRSNNNSLHFTVEWFQLNRNRIWTQRTIKQTNQPTQPATINDLSLDRTASATFVSDKMPISFCSSPRHTAIPFNLQNYNQLLWTMWHWHCHRSLRAGRSGSTRLTGVTGGATTCERITIRCRGRYYIGCIGWRLFKENGWILILCHRLDVLHQCICEKKEVGAKLKYANLDLGSGWISK